jgi:hypothetical protein
VRFVFKEHLFLLSYSLFLQSKFLYWIENSLLSGFRFKIFDWVVANSRSFDEIVRCLSFPALQKLAAVKASALSELIGSLEMENNE